MIASARRRRRQVDIWPGYVDALSALLILVVFVLLLFTFGQFLLSQLLTSKETELVELNRRLQALTVELGLEKSHGAELQNSVNELSSVVSQLTNDKFNLSTELLQTKEQRDQKKLQVEEQLKLQISLQEDISTLRDARAKLEQEVGTLAANLKDRELDLETIRDRSKALQAKLASAEELTRLSQIQIESQTVEIQGLSALAADQRNTLSRQRELSLQSRAEVARLNQQVDLLREQLSEISRALDIKSNENAQQHAKIEDLGKRLNLALAREVNRLAEYRSEFFGRLKELLAETEGVEVVGDRFLFQSELLFESGSATLEQAGRLELGKLAQSLAEIAKRIPDDIEWVLRVDGHTDRQPISTPRFPSNWELSTARAVSVVRYLTKQGIPPQRLTAAGFAEYHPLDLSRTEAAYRSNRRIELKLTSR